MKKQGKSFAHLRRVSKKKNNSQNCFCHNYRVRQNHKSTLHNSIVLAIFVPKIIKVGKNSAKLWDKQFWVFFETRCILFDITNQEFR